MTPSLLPTLEPSLDPTTAPTLGPTAMPTLQPTGEPSSLPTLANGDAFRIPILITRTADLSSDFGNFYVLAPVDGASTPAIQAIIKWRPTGNAISDCTHVYIYLTGQTRKAHFIDSDAGTTTVPMIKRATILGC